MTTTITADAIPGYVAGTWTIDPVHSEVGFTVRHMMISKIRGRFSSFGGDVVTGESPLDSSVTATIDLSSIDTGNTDRDTHLRSADFFGVDAHPTMLFKSTGVRSDGADYMLDGELTLRAITKSISLRLELGGFGSDPYGAYRAGFTAIGEIKRSEFGVDFSAVLETGGLVVGDRVDIYLEIEAVLNAQS